MDSTHAEALQADRDRERQLTTLIGLSDRFGDSLSRAFARNVAEGRKLDDVLKTMRQSLIQTGLKLALAPLQQALTQGLGGLLGGSAGGGMPTGIFDGVFSAFAKGGVVARGAVMPFADGGVVAAPTAFPLRGGIGLMGERGPEAVMPLARGPDGKLGVRGGSGRPVAVTVNIATPDAESFRRSEAQVSAALARAVARGQRGM